MRHYFNKEAFIEGLSCVLFALSIFYLIFTGKYLLFIKPGMKIYLYFSATVMVVWAISCFRRISIPQYKMNLNRFLVLVIPMIAMFLPYTVIKASETTISNQTQTDQAYGQTEDQQTNTDQSQNTQSDDTTAAENTTDTASNGSSDSSSDPWSKIPPGLDTENKTITVSDTEFYRWLVQLNSYPDKYEGYTVHIHGTVYRDDSMNENEFAVTRLLMSCCVADLTNCGPLCFYDNTAELTKDAWVNVTGIYHYDTQKGMQIKVTDIEDAEPSEEEYIYPVY